jgi:hypothetical protein
MAISLLHFTTFSQGEGKSIERGEKHYKLGHVESISYADGGLVHASRRERDVYFFATYRVCYVRSFKNGFERNIVNILSLFDEHGS